MAAASFRAFFQNFPGRRGLEWSASSPIPQSVHVDVARCPREGYDEGSEVGMNSVVFGVAIAIATVLTMFLIQKVLDNPNT